jgi:hypothetical protein
LKQGQVVRNLNTVCAVLLFCWQTAATAQSVCAEVKIEIPQAASLERQGFNAKLGIENGVAAPILQFDVDLEFKDAQGNLVVFTSDPNSTTAKFFVRLESSPGITGGLAGAGQIAGQTSAEANWLIIPTAGAGGTLPTGLLYYVGATVSYVQNGEAKSLHVLPDSITVEPQPKLKLDYFLASDVYGDDAFTPNVVEPSEPFTLGVRIKNIGAGPSRQTNIESAQPRIVENAQGLAVSFNIANAYVQNDPVQNTLLLNFGEIASQTSKVGRWLMTTSLSGRFVDFQAEFTHSDQLGGALTSLIQSVTPHPLVHDVTVNIPGRDSIRDFLALDGDTYRTYESDGTDTIVIDRSAAATLTQVNANVYRVRTLSSTLSVYANVVDPSRGTWRVAEFLRATDNSVLPIENAWLSKKRRSDGITFDYFLNVYDAQGTGDYLVRFDRGALASISGTVFRDLHGDSIQQPNEVGVAAAKIRASTVIAGTPIEREVLSNPLGAFSVADLPAANYTLRVGAMPGLRDVVPIAGDAGGTASLLNNQAVISEITLGNGASPLNYKFIKVATSPNPQADISIEMSTLSPSIGIGETTDVFVRVKNNGPDAALASANLQVELGGGGLVVVSATPTWGSFTSGLWTIPTLAVQEEVTLALRLRLPIFGARILVGRVRPGVLPDPDTVNNLALLRLGASSIPGDLFFENGFEAIQGLTQVDSKAVLALDSKPRAFVGDASGVLEVLPERLGVFAPPNPTSSVAPPETMRTTPLTLVPDAISIERFEDE